jgi:hypothetical protein
MLATKNYDNERKIIQYFSFNEILSWTLSAIMNHHCQKKLFQHNIKPKFT